MVDTQWHFYRYHQYVHNFFSYSTKYEHEICVSKDFGGFCGSSVYLCSASSSHLSLLAKSVSHAEIV